MTLPLEIKFECVRQNGDRIYRGTLLHQKYFGAGFSPLPGGGQQFTVDSGWGFYALESEPPELIDNTLYLPPRSYYDETAFVFYVTESERWKIAEAVAEYNAAMVAREDAIRTDVLRREALDRAKKEAKELEFDSIRLEKVGRDGCFELVAYTGTKPRAVLLNIAASGICRIGWINPDIGIKTDSVGRILVNQ